MISLSHDDDERIVGYIEWWQVGQSGFHKPYGEYVWIKDMWIHENYRNTHVFSELVQDVLDRSHGAKWCYFAHRKYRGRISKLYTRQQFENLVRKAEEKWAAIQI